MTAATAAAAVAHLPTCGNDDCGRQLALLVFKRIAAASCRRRALADVQNVGVSKHTAARFHTKRARLKLQAAAAVIRVAIANVRRRAQSARHQTFRALLLRRARGRRRLIVGERAARKTVAEPPETPSGRLTLHRAFRCSLSTSTQRAMSRRSVWRHRR